MTFKLTLSKVLQAELSTCGFIRKGSSWYLRQDEVIAVLNLQKSNYDNTYFLNLGFWLRQFDNIPNPPVEQCHVRSRADSLWPDENPGVMDLLGGIQILEPEEKRFVAIRAIIRDKVIPFLTQGSSISGLKIALKQFRQLIVRRVAWDLLDVQRNEST